MKKVLVLEDEANIRSFVVINLKRAGYNTVELPWGKRQWPMCATTTMWTSPFWM